MSTGPGPTGDSDSHRKNSVRATGGLAALVLMAVVLAACDASTPHASTTGSVAGSGGTSTTVASTSSIPATTTTSTTSVGATEGRADAVAACRTWQVSDGQDSAEGSATIRTAAEEATRAAGLDSQWTALATTMSFVASLPETSNTPANVAQAQVDIHRIQASCGAFGISISD